MTSENDLVLIHMEDNPMTFARIESILPDAKKDWYHVKLLMLYIPIQVVTWILRDTYIDGGEFTMNGVRMRLEKVVCPEEPDELPETEPEPEASKEKTQTSPGSNVISFPKKDT